MQQYLNKLGFTTISRSFYDYINFWNDWYSGKVKNFHSYCQYNGKKMIARERASLSMAKKVCEDWANLLLNEKVCFNTDSDEATKRARVILENNNFAVRSNQLVELAFALGTGAFVEYSDGKNVKVDYVRADMIFPISWDNSQITDCAFASEKIIGSKKYIYIQLHLKENGKYVIKNRMFDALSQSETTLPDGVVPDFYTNSDIPLFQIISPNIINNIDLNNPMGISVFAGAIDILKGVDLVYDSYQNEFRLGKKRIIIPAGMAQMQNGSNGMTPLFDDNDTEFYALPDKSLTDLREINMELRSEAHSIGLQQNLDLLSDRCGLGIDRYRYNSNQIKTATEIISNKSAMFQNLKKHEILLNKAICDLVNAVLFLDGKKRRVNVRVDFDDSIITDTQTEFNQNMQLVSAGIMPKHEFRMWWFDESEKQARQSLSEV